MRNTFTTILALMAGATLFGACSKEDISDNGEVIPTGNMTFTATVGDDEGGVTRTALDGLNVVWSAGDEISVISDGDFNTNSKFTLASEAGKTNASFTGTCAKGSNYYAVFPYHKDNEYYFDGLLIKCDCREQTAVKGSFDPSVSMLAKTTGVDANATSVSLNFKNLFSFVKVTTDYKCKSITLTSKNSSRYLSSAEQYIMFDEDGNPYVKGYDYYSNSVTLKGKDGANIEAGTYYIAVYPSTLDEGFDLTFTSFTGEQTYTKSTDKSVTLKRSKVLNLGNITLRGTAVETLEGKGTSEDPYKIQDLDDLITFQRWITSEKGETWKKSYLQTADIDADGKKMAPIGTAAHRFWGRYDGGNHYIKNLCIEGTIEYKMLDSYGSFNNKATALFGAIKDATICNLTIENPSFSFGENNSCNFNTVSPFVGVAYSADATFETSRCKILNCNLKGDCSFNFPSAGDWSYMYYGGFVADSQSNLEITDCYTDMNLTFNYNRSNLETRVGGFIGRAVGVNIDNSNSLERDAYVRINRCRNNCQTMTFEEKGAINKICIGGFIGTANDLELDDDVACKIYNSVNNATIQVIKKGNEGAVNIGGFVGYNDSDGYSDVDPTIENCINNGNLTVSSSTSANSFNRSVGGFNAYNYDDDTKFTNCVNTGTLNTDKDFPYASAISDGNGTFYECWNCTGNYSICNSSPGDMTNCGQKSMDEIVDHMNSTPSVTSDPNNYFHRWKRTTINGRDALDLVY